MTEPSNFIRDIIDADLETNKYGGRVVTRFPPEPNGYLHIGHAKSICLNFGLAADYEGACHLRFDDTNPEKEDEEYANAIQRDIQWLGFNWERNLFYASDYYEQLFEYAVQLIKQGKAYVCSLSEEEVREYRGSLTEPGRESPYRSRTVSENLDLFDRMRAGEFQEGEHVLRARIDMASANMKMRDPLLYRIKYAPHYRQGSKWCIYPLYDFTHCLSDYIERITHSICTLEFENNRELYDWVLDELGLTDRPYQFEFARLNLNYTVMSKRKLLVLVNDKHVDGWDDPRMPTIAGYRRRGVTAEAIRHFCERIGLAKNNSTVDIALFEHVVRDDLNARAERRQCVLEPLKVVIENFPDGDEEWLTANSFPADVGRPGSREIPFSKTIYIERSDFEEDPPPKYFRLAPGREVRLRNAYFLKCNEVIHDADGNVVELLCTYDPATKGGKAPDGRKVKGTIHWVSAQHSLPCEVRVYDRLFKVENPNDGNFIDHLNPESLVTYEDSRVEPSVKGAQEGDRFQFERQGYFTVDPDSTAETLKFNRVVSLKDSWARMTSEKPEKPAPKKVKSTPQPSQRPEKKVVVREQRDPLTEPEVAAFAAQATAVCGDKGLVKKWIKNELLRELKSQSISELRFDGTQFGQLLALIGDGTVSTGAAKEVFAELVKNGGDPSELVESLGLVQMDDSAELAAVVDKVIAENPGEAERFRSGEKKLMGFFVGQIMRATGGKANPKLTSALILEKLS